MLARFDLINLIRDVTYDDAFYYFEIASNLAEGKFSTFDGGITRTNGYHPLWLFLVTPFYWVFDKEAALFAIKAFEIMLVAGGVALVTAAAREARLPWVLMFAALPMLYQHHALIAGMEAAAGLFMLGLFILIICLFARSPTRWKWPLAAVAFALPWVRLEYIAISLATTAALCLIEWSRQERAPGAPLGERARSAFSLKAAAPFLAAGAGILVYFAYNKVVFGGIVPVSGAVKAALSQVLWKQEGGYGLTQNLLDTLQMDVFDLELRVALEVCAYLLLVWWLARRSRTRKDWLLLAFLAGVFGLAVGHLAKFGQTILTVHPFLQGDFAWYFVPAYLLMALIVPVRCWVAIYLTRRFFGPKSPRAANILSLGIVVAGAAFLLANVDFARQFRWVEGRSNSTNRDGWSEGVYGGTLLMNRVLPEDSVLGSWDTGVTGYFSRFPVVNLDGLVNSYDYFHARNVARDGYPVWDAEFIPLYRELGITYLANFMITSLEGKTLFEEGRLLFEGSASPPGVAFYLWPIELPEDDDAAAWVWKRMEPHFDYQSDGAGLLVDGRLAQTFARECDPEELVLWSWDGPGDGTVTRAWTRTQTGLCVTAAVLPLTVSSPVRFETMSDSDYLTWLTGGSTPIIRSDWDVYLVGDSLIYAKDECSPEDAEPEFFVHLDPVDRNDLPGHRKQYGFDGFNFDFRNHLLDGEVCVTRRELPDYAIAAIRTGQFLGDGEKVWEGSFEVVEPVETMLDSDYLIRLTGGGLPVIRSDWDVYLVEDSLIYTKDKCSPEDTEPMFFVHLDPVDRNDLPGDRKQYGFDGFNFDFRNHLLDGEVCVARRELPDYAIAAIRTGQFLGDGEKVWEGSFDVVEPADDGSAAR